MNLEKYPFLDLKDTFNRLQEELNELITEASDASKAISKMRRFSPFDWTKDGVTGIEKLEEKMKLLSSEWNDVCLCINEAARRVDNGELDTLGDWR